MLFNFQLSTEKALESEENATGDEHDEALLLDPGTVHELAARGDEDALSVLLKVSQITCVETSSKVLS